MRNPCALLRFHSNLQPAFHAWSSRVKRDRVRDPMRATELIPFQPLATVEHARDYIKIRSRKSRSRDSNFSDLPADFSCLSWTTLPPSSKVRSTPRRGTSYCRALI